MKLMKESHDKSSKKHSSREQKCTSSSKVKQNGAHSSKMKPSDVTSIDESLLVSVDISSKVKHTSGETDEMDVNVTVGPVERHQNDGHKKSHSSETINKHKSRSKSSKERHNEKVQQDRTADVNIKTEDHDGCHSAADPQASPPVKIKKKKVKDEKTDEKHDTADKNHSARKKRKSESSERDQPEKKPKKMKTNEEKKKEKMKEKGDEGTEKWKWWEEGKSSDTQKWTSLEHRGPYFPPEYEPLPSNISFNYEGKPLKLTPQTEEIATFYAKMLEHEYTTKDVFQKNFFNDWREVLKEEASRLLEEYGFCLLDGHREKIGNFKLEPPGLFRGRGEHPKMGKLKKRLQPEDVIINCSADSKIPEPPKGHKWKRVQHENTVTWLVSWVENIHGRPKYIMLNPSSKLKGEKDWQKYETARKLKMSVNSIRKEYKRDWTSREMKTRQRGVALYFIDKLALRAGNEKDDESADTVGCCSLRVEHISLHKRIDGQEFVVEFDFLGKDSIRYYNKVPVEKQVFKNLRRFMEHKDPEDDLFDRITTVYLNKTLNESMPGLTAKVFRTFNASTTLQDQLRKLTTEDMTLEEKMLSYNRANRAVAILCNHQRAAPKTFEKSMQLLQEKIKKKKEQIEEARKELKEAKRAHKETPSDKSSKLLEKKEKKVQNLCEQLKKLQLQETDREENKVIALGTSKLNYLDPRITVAWCKKYQVPIEKIYNKTQRDKFAWAIDMTDEDFQF
ncbi:DNA topoisomerase I, mitochondrial isoform X3 [Triplophysa dalaica]|uniref:DNA topoisomerase I, mitochondrial isoform X3 n=1 Tax=Triplophysa dalaica TaxID=1582913 RepID=UPI0024DF61DF|nr:DNA topoisomerase I, mitochondrial isoform X3 [Triplophysa dalaica]